MSDIDRQRRQRRRSQRIRRQSLSVFPSLPYKFDGQNDCPDDTSANQESVISSAEFDVSQAISSSDCGSFWLDVDELALPRKPRSRRSSIGVYHMKPPVRDFDIGDTVRSPCDTEYLALQISADSSNIEIMRKPFSEADLSMPSPPSFVITDHTNLGTSFSRTPHAMVKNSVDKSLPCLATPTSPGDRLADGKGDAFAVGATSMGDEDFNVSCPASCEDDVDDSLLICTPDLSRFQKNIRFKCSIDFSEIDQTPTKGDTSDADCNESIHESPIVSYAYDKLKSSDVVRRRRSTSTSKQDNLSGKKQSWKRGTPRKLLPSHEWTETDVQDVSPVKWRALTYELKSAESEQSLPPNRPFSNIKTTPSSISHLDDNAEDDFMSVSNDYPASADTPVIVDVSPSTPFTPVDVSPFTPLTKTYPKTPDPMSPVSRVRSRSNTNKLILFGHSNDNCTATGEGSPETGHNENCAEFQRTDSCLHVTERDQIDPVGHDCTQNISTHNNDGTGVDLDGMRSDKMTEETPGTPHTGTPNCDIPVTPCVATSTSKNKEEHHKTKERNIATDVCNIIRSLAKKFSNSAKKKKKKKRKSTTKCGEGTLPATSCADSEMYASSTESEVLLAQNGFTFRKTQKLLEYPTPVAESTPETVAVATTTTTTPCTPSPVLDFSPFLPPTEAVDNVHEDVAHSPILKLHNELHSITESTVCEHVQNEDKITPIVANQVLPEKSDPECVEVVPRRRGRAKRRSIEAQTLQKECEEFMAKEQTNGEDVVGNGSALRRSRRSRRSSLEIFRYAAHTEDANDLPADVEEKSESDPVPTRSKKGRKSKKSVVEVEENLEDLYRNKNYKLPTERMWETLFESPDRCKQTGVFQSRRKYRRTISFESVNPVKMRRRLQKAATQGWDVTGRKRKQVALDEVKDKLAALSAELSP